MGSRKFSPGPVSYLDAGEVNSEVAEVAGLVVCNTMEPPRLQAVQHHCRTRVKMYCDYFLSEGEDVLYVLWMIEMR